MHESGEMYLETILVLSAKAAPVRAIDVGAEMGFSKPSVSRALGLLKEQKHIEVDENGSITLTPTGRDIAEKIYERHTVLTKLLTGLGVSPETAQRDACKIEHDISDESFETIKSHLEGKTNSEA